MTLTLDVCPVCGLVSGQLAWDVPTEAGECAGVVACGTDHEPAQMERAEYVPRAEAAELGEAWSKADHERFVLRQALAALERERGADDEIDGLLSKLARTPDLNRKNPTQPKGPNMSTTVELDPIPCSYAYVAQLQGAAQALAKALDATADQRCDGAEAARHIVEARQRIENIWDMQAEGVVS